MPLPILCYHKVGSESEEGRRLNIDPERLRAHVRYFKRRGHRFMAAADLAQPWPVKGVCLTFDDAYTSALENGLPVLRDEGVTASFYAVTDLVGRTSVWDGDQARPLADWPALLAAAQAGFEIGNHTRTHRHAHQIAAAEFAAEVAEAGADLEAHGLAARSFCYPYGSCNPATRQLLADAGIPIALALGKRQAEPTDDLLELPRIVIAFSDGLPKLLYKLHVRPRLP